MERFEITPRPNWQAQVEKLGLVYHTTNGQPFWNESAYYRFTSAEVDEMEAATEELHRLCLEAAQHIIDKNRFAELGIPAKAIAAIRQSWEAEPPSLYGRFDLAYDGESPPKMLEYNADTPTTLLEAAVVQWYWLQDKFPQSDQFNSIWEGLVAKWTELKNGRYLLGSPVYFAHVDDYEDLMTASVLRDTAQEAGIETAGILMHEIGWDRNHSTFVDMQNQTMRTVFKLYPWEWMMQEEFGNNLLQTYTQMQWIEPIWKMLWSNKGILAILWELFPGHPNLLEAHIGHAAYLDSYARKPLLSREGANITLKEADRTFQSTGEYGGGEFVYQDLADIPDFAGNRPVIGSWVVDGKSRGIGIRESSGPITDNMSRFVPHLFD